MHKLIHVLSYLYIALIRFIHSYKSDMSFSFYIRCIFMSVQIFYLVKNRSLILSKYIQVYKKLIRPLKIYFILILYCFLC